MRWTTVLLWAQAAITGITGVVLFASPETIPQSFGLRLTPDAHLLCYFYGATEFALSVASLVVARVSDPRLRRAAFSYFAAVHVAQAAAAALAVSQGISSSVLANGAAHLAIAILFVMSLSAERGMRAPGVLQRSVS